MQTLICTEVIFTTQYFLQQGTQVALNPYDHKSLTKNSMTSGQRWMESRRTQLAHITSLRHGFVQIAQSRWLWVVEGGKRGSSIFSHDTAGLFVSVHLATATTINVNLFFQNIHMYVLLTIILFCNCVLQLALLYRRFIAIHLNGELTLCLFSWYLIDRADDEVHNPTPLFKYLSWDRESKLLR